MPSSELREAALVLRGENGSWHFDLDSPKRIEERVGHDLLIVFFRCLVGIDRVVSLRHLHILNEQEAGGENKAANNRNDWVLRILLIGTMHEFGKALDAIQTELYKANLRDHLPSWDRMMAIRRRWAKEKIGEELRNKLAHHWDDPELYAKGLEKACLGDTFTLCRADSSKPVDNYYIGAWELLVAGLGMNKSDLTNLFDQLFEDVRSIEEIVLSVLVEVFGHFGIPVVDERAKQTMNL